MNVFEIISAIVLIIACIFIVVVVMMKDTKTQMSQTISGTKADSFYQKNAGRTKEAMLNKATIAAAVIFFVMAIAVNIINVYWGGSKEDEAVTSSAPDATVSSVALPSAGDTSDASDISDTSGSGAADSSDNSSDNSADSSSAQ